MNKTEFIQLLNGTETWDAEKIIALQDLSSNFPYFQTAQLLLSKAFHETENINFEFQLRKSAAYASDRKRLHELIFSEQLQAIEQEQVLEKSIEDTPSSPSLAENFQESNADSNPLEQQIISSAISNSIFIEVPDEISDEDLDSLRPRQEQVESSSTEASDESHAGFKLDSPHSFSEWLNFYSVNKPEVSSWDNEEIEDLTELSHEIHDSENSNLPSRKEFYSPAKMAKLSVQENDDLVTETLAQVYADQSNFEKAIKAFEKLQLKYPEKKIYFAGRIKELENQLNKL